MFGWLKKKVPVGSGPNAAPAWSSAFFVEVAGSGGEAGRSGPAAGVLPPSVGKMLGRIALAESIAKSCHAYVEAVSSGKVTVPAIRRREKNVHDVWEDTRTEAMLPLFRHGASDISPSYS